MVFYKAQHTGLLRVDLQSLIGQDHLLAVMVELVGHALLAPYQLSLFDKKGVLVGVQGHHLQP
ncbi:hypothetical protein Mrub_0713 [Meiothermus ruber DSM 1279]|nr:hypothetical protein Mrub_0713 [Meiothermus ruber DSM 1279]GAO74407.1 putative uncharacterized protein [Meiothermus ruber H328]